MSDLLTERLIRLRLTDRSAAFESLPGVYEGLVSDRVEAFPALRPHQRHAWHAFLAQLAVLALVRAGRKELPGDADEWCQLLRGLTPDFPGDEPWRLFVEDHSVPGFMQCPAPQGLTDYKRLVATPDDLDLLVTSKNHDVKSSIAAECEADDWIFALVSLQTMGGFLGAGNYGIARMNGGYSSRPCLGLAPSDGGSGAHLVHDIGRMLARRPHLLDQYEQYFAPDAGAGLLWLTPWDGTESLRLTDVDPYCIEICRRVRLERRGRGIVALAATSRKPRIAAKEAKGDLGDHWTPIAVGAETKALSVTSAGFRYDQLARLILDRGAFDHSPAMSVNGPEGASWRLVARAVAAGQGKTEGYHERLDIVFGPRVVRSLLSRSEGRATLEELAKLQVSEVREVVSALRFGIATAASGGKDADALGKPDWEKATSFARRLDTTADTRFFGALQQRFGATAEDAAAARRTFVKKLIGDSETLLREAIRTVPCAAIRRYRAEARGMSAFHSRLRRSDVLRAAPDVFESPGEENGDDA